MARTPVARPFSIVTRCALHCAIIVHSPLVVCASRRNVTAVDRFPSSRHPNTQYPHCVVSHPHELRAIGDHA
jgi:hypothetical protein